MDFPPLSRSLGDLIHPKRDNIKGMVLIYIFVSRFFLGTWFRLAQAGLAGPGQPFTLPVSQTKALSAGGRCEVCVEFTGSFSHYYRAPAMNQDVTRT